MSNKHLRLWFYAILLLLLLSVTALTSFIATTSGSRWLINHAIQDVPSLTIDTINGSLLHGLQLSGIEYQHHSGNLKLEHLSIHWQATRLFAGIIGISSLHAERVTWQQTADSPSQNTPFKLEESIGLIFDLPVALHIKHAEFKQVTLTLGDHTHYIEQAEINAKLNQRALLIHQLQLDGLWKQSPLRLSGHGTLLKAPAYQLKLNLDWHTSALNDMDFSGRLHLNGDLESLAVQHTLFSPHPIASTGRIDLNKQPSITLNNIIQPYRWQNTAGDIHLKLHKANVLAQLHADRYTLNANIVTGIAGVDDIAAQIQADGDFEHIKISKFSITSASQQASGQASAEIVFSPMLSINTDTKLNIANNLIFISGQLNRQLDFNWRINANNPQALVPALSGTLNSHGSLKGTPDRLIVNGVLHGKSLRYDSYSVEQLTISAQSKNVNANTIDIKAQSVVINQQTIDQFNAALKGGIRQHTLHTTLQHPLGTLQLEVSGAYQSKTWSGNLDSAEIRSIHAGQWTLEQPTPVSITTASLSINRHCWQQDRSTVCTKIQFDKANGIHSFTELNGLPARLLQAYIDPGYQLEGDISGKLNVKGLLPSVAVEAKLLAPAGSWSKRVADETDNKHLWENAQLTLKGQYGQDWLLTASAVLPDIGRLTNRIAIDQQNNLRGTLSAQLSNLNWLQPFVPQLSQLKGEISANARISGTVRQPQLQLNAQLTQGYAVIPGLKLTLNEIKIDAYSNDTQNIHISASTQSGKGTLYSQGVLTNPLQSDWQLKLNLSGEHVQFINLAQIRADVNPQLSLSLSQQLFEIQGTANLPSATIDVVNLPSGIIDISPDATELRADTLTPDTKWVINSQIELILGDDIHFQGFGINSQLSGQLTIREKVGQTAQAFGELLLINGQYKAYGQKLTVEEGSKLIFQGLLDNPALSIRATRQAGDIIAGIELGGTLKKPRSRLFSTPPMPETEIAAILVTGKPLSSASETDANAITNAIAVWGLERGGQITQKLSETFKLDTLTINSQDNLDQSSLLLGKYLTPRLYIKYAVGLFNQDNTLGLEYQINKRLKLDAQSGTQRSMDLIYKIEK